MATGLIVFLHVVQVTLVCVRWSSARMLGHMLQTTSQSGLGWRRVLRTCWLGCKACTVQVCNLLAACALQKCGQMAFVCHHLLSPVSHFLALLQSSGSAALQSRLCSASRRS